ncbi:uncharacterized protein [Anoplolepis gracilipes]|uniref:uncharacterized protein n=1 Tax=Anoplolepis gracilipes TaxID=354296 RepID=UPI003B9FFACB
MSSSQRPRRPSVSIYDYPEHLNPFNDDTTNSQSQVYHEGKSSKESKHKFWTFGKSRKKRSNSFSIKSTWNGLFGKRKESSEPIAEKRSTITTVSTTYKREPYDRPVQSRLSKDQQEFDEALGTLTRRRKYTLDNNSSRCSSNLTMNGDPKIYDGNPQDTTTSIMGVDLTPKPPVRRFGQVSPRPTDKIPPLNFEDKHPNQNGSLHDKLEKTPVPPMRRFGNRSSQRLNGTALDLEEDPANRSGNMSLKDENENVPEDYVFKRFSQDAVRKSNLSINSCVSVTSTASTYGRKKRRAPQPPKRKEQLEISLESNGHSEMNKTESTPETKIELQIIEPINIIKATENIDEMTKKSCEELNEKSLPQEENRDELSKTVEDTSDDIAKNITKDETCEVLKDCVPEVNEKKDPSEERSTCNSNGISENVELKTKTEEKEQNIITKDPVEKDPVNIEYSRTSQEKIEIIKDVDQESDEVCLRKKDSLSTLSRNDSFSVKEEIEKIEKQIKALESKNASKEQEKIDACDDDQVTSTRLSIQANRRHFFENMVDSPSGPIKLEFKKLPCEQKDIHVVRLTDPPIPVAAPRDTVKVIELHISEPIRHKPELLDEVNPIPKPRRHSALSLRNLSESRLSKNENKSLEDNGKRGSF